MADDNDDALDPAEIEALLKSAGDGTAQASDPASAPAVDDREQPASRSPAPHALTNADVDALLKQHPRGAPAGNPEELLERATADLAAAVAPDFDFGESRAERAAAAKPFEFQSFDQGPTSDLEGDLNNLKDVELDLRIELGRTELLIEEVLKLREGSVVALDKLAGDPVDVLVNGRLIARGEVLVLNDNFCVRIAEILAPALE